MMCVINQQNKTTSTNEVVNTKSPFPRTGTHAPGEGEGEQWVPIMGDTSQTNQTMSQEKCQTLVISAPKGTAGSSTFVQDVVDNIPCSNVKIKRKIKLKGKVPYALPQQQQEVGVTASNGIKRAHAPGDSEIIKVARLKGDLLMWLKFLR